MRLLHLGFFFVVCIKLFICSGCGSANEKEGSIIQKKTKHFAEYDLNRPFIVNLPHKLDEISGISYYEKDTSLFAITDDEGNLFKIYLNRNYIIKSWHFDSKHDFEDLVLQDSIFYILISNGDIVQLKFTGNVIEKTKVHFPEPDNSFNEFETLYFDNKKGIVLICKNCDKDKRKAVSAYGYDPLTKTYSPIYQINVLPIDEKINEQKIHLRPSAAAINPITNELYILCSINKLLVITDREGNFKEVYSLDGTFYKQPEGIAFLPNGDMIISNESNKTGSPTLLIFKRKTKN